MCNGSRVVLVGVLGVHPLPEQLHGVLLAAGHLHATRPRTRRHLHNVELIKLTLQRLKITGFLVWLEIITK